MHVDVLHDDLAAPTYPRRPRALLTVRQLSERHPGFSTGALRQLIFAAEPRKGIPGNGFDVCIRRIGRKLLIDEALFLEWIDRQQAKAKGGNGHAK